MKICSFNVENLFLSPIAIHPDGSLEQKIRQPGDSGLDKLKGLARTLLDIDADVYALIEVGSEEILKEFNSTFLGSKYKASLIEGNSDRGIHIGYLIKKDLPYTFEHFTHRNRLLSKNYSTTPTYLSRDIAELRLFHQTTKKLSMILLAVHLKSKRTEASSDFGGKRRREAEFNLLLKTYAYLNQRYQGNVPILLLGDFNGMLSGEKQEPEFDRLKRYPELKDILDIIALPPEMRITQISFDRLHNRLAEQFDYILVPQKWWPNIDSEQSGIYLFKDEAGGPYPLPNSGASRAHLPSDHYPVIIKFTDVQSLSTENISEKK